VPIAVFATRPAYAEVVTRARLKPIAPTEITRFITSLRSSGQHWKITKIWLAEGQAPKNSDLEEVLRASHWRTDDVRSSALTAVRAAPTISRFLSEVVVKDVVSPVILRTQNTGAGCLTGMRLRAEPN
jgi:hypothetical protein